MQVLHALICMVLLLGNTFAACPHKQADLKKWSDAATWGTAGKPTEGKNVVINDKILMDESPPSLYNVTINAGALLTFNPDVTIDFRAGNIFVDGTFEIGSSDCPYNGSLTITLTGTRQEHEGEAAPKGIIVNSGATFNIYGEPRLAWTKLTNHIRPPTTKADGILFEHKLEPSYQVEGIGVFAYTFTINGTDVTVKTSGLYSMKKQATELAAQINAVADGEVLMLASQEKVSYKDPSKQDFSALEALETLAGMSGNCLLRSIPQDGATYAFIYKKGTPSSLKEVTNPLGTTTSVRYKDVDGLFFTAESIGERAFYKQTVNFQVANIIAMNPKVDLLEDCTTWREGDKIAFASTDYDPEQSEERTIVHCRDCTVNQIRISEPLKFWHYGQIYKNLDMRGEVALLSRKIVIRGEVQSTCPTYNGNCAKEAVRNMDTFGGHILLLKGFISAKIENIELYNMGQQMNLGRYPIHFHLCLGDARGSYVKGCSIHNTFARCVTIHATHEILVQDNVCYDHLGHGFFLEDGAEFNNTFDGNLVFNTRKGTGDLEPSDVEPAGMWITNPHTYIRNNVAAGGEGFGIWVLFPLEPLPPSRQYNLMSPYEARKTNLLEYTNNVAHSNIGMGMKLGGRIEEDRTTYCCNNWQPLENPKDNGSKPIDVYFERISGYKNSKFNLWFEGSLLQVSKISTADSISGVIISNEKMTAFAGRLHHSVIIGESDNYGVPGVNFTRSFPLHGKIYDPHSGLAMWRGPCRYDNLYFDGYPPNKHYDIAAIMKKRVERYYFSVTNNFKDIQFAFDDEPNGAAYAMSGNKTDIGWEKQKDGELVMGFTWYKKTGNVTEKWYIVKPDVLSRTADDCKLRPNWRLAFCKTKYGNFRVNGNFFNLGSRGIYVLDKYPVGQQEYILEKAGGPQIVIDGTRSYTFHTVGEVPNWMKMTAEGLEVGDKVRIGFCVPKGATWTLSSSYPLKLKKMADFIEVDSLAELDKDEPGRNGKKYYFDNATSMVYYKFYGATNRSENDNQVCGGGICPMIQLTLAGNLSANNGDCRSTLYSAEQMALVPPELPLLTETFVANAGPEPPADFGHGSSRPFTSRSAVNGKNGQWSEWSSCSVTCGSGYQYKKRECNNPMPQHGGTPCPTPHYRERNCKLDACT
ncbi:protein DDB_G0287365-like isoform X2 [Ruditapes philippinarum]|uniref:protein DDB_G0287365-like isoform X2 n=1 Tax=Ruditapes philippinarum TaxID=129788 RepID=UPI00295C0986|nr:protein DDB_G0287365-like isoform X2 [Ruditapes philippinarum]